MNFANRGAGDFLGFSPQRKPFRSDISREEVNELYDSDSGYAYWEGQYVYWDKEDAYGNVINIFPGGMPPRNHFSHDHDHIKVRGASVTTLRGQTVITGGYVTYKRINGIEH